MNDPSIGIAILTLNAATHLRNCLTPLLASPLIPRICIIDSSSDDATVSIAKDMGVEVISILRKNFNHGKTREMARRHLNTDIVVMVTQDAYALNANVLEILLQPLFQRKASVAYARQIPHEGASFFASFLREFNYPTTSHVRSLQDVPTYGAYTFFCSNSFAAYYNPHLEEIGGFSEVILGEDTLAAAQLLHKGYRIAYVSEALVHHSHEHTLMQEWHRYFAIGQARTQYRTWLTCQGSDAGRGKEYVKALLKALLKRNLIYHLPYAIVQIFVKWVAYRCGSLYATSLNLIQRLQNFVN